MWVLAVPEAWNSVALAPSKEGKKPNDLASSLALFVSPLIWGKTAPGYLQWGEIKPQNNGRDKQDVRGGLGVVRGRHNNEFSVGIRLGIHRWWRGKSKRE